MPVRGRYSFENEHEGGGHVYGEISAKDNTTPLTLAAASIVKISLFDTNGLSNLTTPDADNDNITIQHTGIYEVSFNIHLINDAAQKHIIDVSLYGNNGTVEFLNVHGHRTLAVSSDVGAMSASGIVEILANETIELWATTDSSSDRGVIFEDINIHIIEIG